ncbi:MGMT family protein [Candidatus Micrarchaeota archaeon]|nr:MGMT family protein [Candidatus Micrarchaeota archaeon]
MVLIVVNLTSAEKKEFDSLTEFQQKVLIACSEIPKGETRTYSQIAVSIGKPKAVRAVGTALARNPFAPKIPCHRVVAKNGLGGYSGKGGLATKKRLLKKEKG